MASLPVLAGVVEADKWVCLTCVSAVVRKVWVVRGQRLWEGAGASTHIQRTAGEHLIV